MSDTKTAATNIAYLTAGVDVMKDHLIVGIYGWSNDCKPTLVQRLELQDEFAYDPIWLRLEKALSGNVMCADGVGRKVEATCIDAGAHNAQDVYRFVRTTGLRRAYAVKLVNNSLPYAWPKKPRNAATTGPVTKFYAVNINRIFAKLASVAGIETPSDDLMLAAAAREALRSKSAEFDPQPDDHATHGDGDVRTADLAHELNTLRHGPNPTYPGFNGDLGLFDQHHGEPLQAAGIIEKDGTVYLTSSSDVASEPFTREIADWGDDHNRFYFDHTITIGLGRWYLEVSLSTLNRLRPFAEREAQCLGVTSWRAGALGFEIELERYAS